MDFYIVQFLTGLASASSLFLVAVGLSIIFGVSRIVNFAHGSLFMVGAYLALTISQQLGLGFWGALLIAPLGVAVLGGVLEITILRRIYHAPELFQLLATFGVALIVGDLVLMIWGPEDMIGPRAPGLTGAVEVLGRKLPAYDLFLICLGPLVLGLLWLLFQKTRFGVLIRAATQDRTMVTALGVDQRLLFTGVFMLGALLAGLGGALQLPRETIHNHLDLQIIVEAFVVVVIGGMGSIVGAFGAAVLIGLVHAFGIVWFPEATLVMIFLVMAAVLTVKPQGLFGRGEAPHAARQRNEDAPLMLPPSMRQNMGLALLFLACLAMPLWAGDFAVQVMTEILIFALFTASLHMLTGMAGVITFGHAAFFGLGGYGAALMATHLGWGMEAALVAAPLVALAGAALFGAFALRLSGVYLAMLTLAFAEILHAAAFQWVALTGGDNGMLGLWPAPWVSDIAAGPVAASGGLFWLVLVIVGAALLLLRYIMWRGFGYALRAVRDSALRAEACGISVARTKYLALLVSALAAGLAGGLHVFFKGSVFPDLLGVGTTVDGLVMMLLGGIHSLLGPLVGAAGYKLLFVSVSLWVDHWRMVIGAVILLLVILFPEGVVGGVWRLWRRFVPVDNRKGEGGRR